MLSDLANDLGPIFRAQGRLIRLPDGYEIVYVGDTHGDREATERVFDQFLDPSRIIVFLGDTVDRGPDSPGNLRLILETKRRYPESVYLLMGNHEGWAFSRFSPADFWYGLSDEEEAQLSGALSELPYAAWHPVGVLATHGGLPDVDSLDALPQIEPKTAAWRDITWGDWTDETRGLLPTHPVRPAYDERVFARRMAHLGARLLVRSHQPTAPLHLFMNRCLTLFTTSAYGSGKRHVAVLAPQRRPKATIDLRIEAI